MMINVSSTKIKIISTLKILIGKKNLIKLLKRKYIENYKNNDIIFVHIPKAAGTSITEVLYGKRNGHLTASVIKNELGDDFDKKYSFSVTRNPYDRLKSSYHFARQGQTNDGAIANSKLYQQPVFETFETFVRDWLVHQDLLKLDHVFRPQHHYLYEQEVCLVNEVYQLENLEELENKLSKILNKTVKINKKNATQKTKNREMISDEIKDLIYTLYQKDFELFKYNR